MLAEDVDGLGRLPTGQVAVTDAEEAVYVDLCGLGAATAAQLADATELPQVVVVQALGGLRARSLVRRADGGPPARWTAAAPDVALQQILRDREEEARQLRAGITRLLDGYHRSRGLRDLALGDLVEVVTGRDAIAHLWLSLLEGARERVDILDKPPFVQLDSVGPELAVLARGVPVRSVYERATLLQPGKLDQIRALVSAGEQAGTAADLPFKLALVDARWALLPLAAGTELSGALVVRRSPLLDALIQNFETEWARAIPVPVKDREGREGREGADDGHAELLTLLAAGMTDERIARRLGVSARTVQRRVSALMSGLDASNRFQAGIQANRRGLL